MDGATVLTYDEAAKYLKTSTRHLRELVYRRQIAFTHVGRLVRFRVGDLDCYLEKRTVRPDSPRKTSGRNRRA